MSWPTGAISTGTVAQDKAIWLELNHAMRQRQQSLGQTPSAAWPSSGDTLQDQEKVAEIQNFIIDNFGYFVRSHNADGTARATNYYDGKATIDHWTLANGYAAAGLNAGGFTRFLADNSNAYGVVQTGDQLRKELVIELRAMFGLMVWNLGWHDNNTQMERFGQGGGDGYTWDEAKAEATDNYEASAAYEQTYILRTTTHLSTNGLEARYAEITRASVNIRAYNISTALACVADYYIIVIHAGVFDWSAHGDPVKEELWSLCGSIGPSSDAIRTSPFSTTADGSALTDWPPLPVAPNWVDRGKGYEVLVATVAGDGVNQKVILRWDVAGGLDEY